MELNRPAAETGEGLYFDEMGHWFEWWKPSTKMGLSCCTVSVRTSSSESEANDLYQLLASCTVAILLFCVRHSGLNWKMRFGFPTELDVYEEELQIRAVAPETKWHMWAYKGRFWYRCGQSGDLGSFSFLHTKGKFQLNVRNWRRSEGLSIEGAN